MKPFPGALALSFFIACFSIVHVEGTTFYVDANGTNPVAPYDNWSTAATSIQDAIDAASDGDVIMVTNGIYADGGRTTAGSALTDRVVIDKPVSVQSVNGAQATIIQGYQIPGITNGACAIRCVYLTNGASLTGFTITDGATLPGGNDVQDGGDTSGGGILCVAGATVSNCVFVSNAAGDFGGGSYGGTFYNCLFYDNWATLGVGSYGGGDFGGALYNCTLANNSADNGSGDAFGSLNNCIVYDNDPIGANYDFSSMNYSCTTPDPGGMGEVTNDPAFVNPDTGDYHLQSNSPCINAGDNYYVGTTNDLDGNLRIRGGTVDIGAYEYQNPSSILSYAWAQEYGVPTDGSADYADMDGTGMPNWEKAIAGLNPTNSASVLVMSAPMPMNDGSGTVVSWQSVPTVVYYLQRSSDLTQPFVTIQNNLMGQVGTTSFMDTTATNTGSYFYRIGVQ